MRPSSAGSSRISNWLEPLCARAAIATARPATGTEAALDVAPGDADPAAVELLAATEKPKLGRPLPSGFAPEGPPGGFEDSAAMRVEEAVEGSVDRASA